MTKILVIGAGAWGSAVANLIALNGHEVYLAANKQEIVDEISQKNTNQKFLPKIILSNKIKAINGFENKIVECDLIFIATPSAVTAKIFEEIVKLGIASNAGFIICSKGLDSDNLKFFSESFKEIFPQNNLAILSGPNFAIEVADRLPTLTTIASDDKIFADKIIQILNNDFFLAQYSTSPLFAEICGVIKNIMAIACGIVDALNLGQNARAAIVNRGIEEIFILCEALNVEPDFKTPAGFGDIFLTCATTKSRNNNLGTLLADGKFYEKIVSETKQTYEGAVAAKSIANLARKLNIRLFLCKTIAQIVNSNYNSGQIEEIITNAIFQNDR